MVREKGQGTRIAASRPKSKLIRNSGRIQGRKQPSSNHQFLSKARQNWSNWNGPELRDKGRSSYFGNMGYYWLLSMFLYHADTKR